MLNRMRSSYARAYQCFSRSCRPDSQYWLAAGLVMLGRVFTSIEAVIAHEQTTTYFDYKQDNCSALYSLRENAERKLLDIIEICGGTLLAKSSNWTANFTYDVVSGITLACSELSSFPVAVCIDNALTSRYRTIHILESILLSVIIVGGCVGTVVTCKYAGSERDIATEQIETVDGQPFAELFIEDEEEKSVEDELENKYQDERSLTDYMAMS